MKKKPSVERLRTGEALTDAELRELGTALRTCSPTLSVELRRVLATEYEDISWVFADLVHMPEEGVDMATLAQVRFARMQVKLPPLLVAIAAAILASLPDPDRRGRPPKPSTVEARKLLEGKISKRTAAKLAALAGEDPDAVRKRVSRKPKQKKPRKTRA